MCSAIDTITAEDVSRYPIFVVSQEDIELGISIAQKNVHAGNWNVNASTLEEFVAKNVIHSDKVDEFREVYKPSTAQICVFLNWQGAFTFIFLPRLYINS